VGPPTVRGGNRGPPSLASTGNRGPPSMVGWRTRGPRPMTVTVGPPVFQPWVLLQIRPTRGPPRTLCWGENRGSSLYGWLAHPWVSADLGDRGSSTFAAHKHPSPPSRHPWARGPTLHPWVLLTLRRRGTRGSSSDFDWEFFFYIFFFFEPVGPPSHGLALLPLLRTVGPPDRGSSTDLGCF
jgi:hypothetical protein